MAQSSSSPSSSASSIAASVRTVGKSTNGLFDSLQAVYTPSVNACGAIKLRQRHKFIYVTFLKAHSWTSLSCFCHCFSHPKLSRPFQKLHSRTQDAAESRQEDKCTRAAVNLFIKNIQSWGALTYVAFSLFGLSCGPKQPVREHLNAV